MPYLNQEDLKALKDFYSNPTETNYAILQTRLKCIAMQSREINYGLIEIQKQVFKTMLDCRKNKEAEEKKYREEIEKRYSDYEVRLKLEAEKRAIKEIEQALGKYFS